MRSRIKTDAQLAGYVLRTTKGSTANKIHWAYAKLVLIDRHMLPRPLSLLMREIQTAVYGTESEDLDGRQMERVLAAMPEQQAKMVARQIRELLAGIRRLPE